jgi:hypothetical protein
MQSYSCLTPRLAAFRQSPLYSLFRFQAQGSPLQQRVSFLEAKGLTGPEIEEALRQTTLRNVSDAQPNPYMPMYSLPPTIQPARKWDWRDYFVWNQPLAYI